MTRTANAVKRTSQGLHHGINDDFVIRYAVGTKHDFAKAKNVEEPWLIFCNRFDNPLRTDETFDEFCKLIRGEQDRLKARNGWISGAQCAGNQRNSANIQPRNSITLDLDYPDRGIVEKLAWRPHWSSSGPPLVSCQVRQVLFLGHIQ